MNTLYHLPGLRLSSQFHDFWSVAPGPQLLARLQQSGIKNSTSVRGWSRGGCRIWAEAVFGWIAESCAQGPLHMSTDLYAVRTDETDAAHVLVSLVLGGEIFFLDELGLWTRRELEERLAGEYEYDAPQLIPWSQVCPTWLMIPYDEGFVRHVVQKLFNYLGPFSLQHFSATAVQMV